MGVRVEGASRAEAPGDNTGKPDLPRIHVGKPQRAVRAERTRHLQHFVISPTCLSLSRLNHWLPRGETHPEVMQGTAQFHHEITDARLPQPDPVFDDATTLHATVDMLDPQPAMVQGLVGPLLVQGEFLAAGV